MEPEIDEVPIVRIGPSMGRGWRDGGLVLVALLVVLVIKPWNSPSGPSSSAAPSPTATAVAAATTTPLLIQGSRRYDPIVFGRYEVQPAWEVWPAGYIVRMASTGPLAIDVPAPSGGPMFSAQPGPSPTPLATPPPDARQLLDMGRSENIGVIGLNTPAGVAIQSVELVRFDGPSWTSLALLSLDAPWKSTHFHVYGLAGAEAQPNVLGAWLPGVYRLDVTAIEAGKRVHLAVGLLVRS